MLRNGVAQSCVRMKKSLLSHALNNRENFSPTKLEWDPGNKANSWSCTGIQDTWGIFGSAPISWRLQAFHFLPCSQMPRFLLKSLMTSAEIPSCLLYYWYFAGGVALLQLLICYRIFTQRNAAAVAAMSWFLRHRLFSILSFRWSYRGRKEPQQNSNEVLG